MVYLVQAEEREISLALLQDLAEVLRAASTGLTHADATYRIRSARGMLALEDAVQAESICRRFNELGFPSFVVEKLLEPPKPEHLNLEKAELEGEVKLAVVARLDLIAERTVRGFGRPRLSLTAALAGIPLPVARMEEKKVEESDTRFCLDLFTVERHWRARPGSTLPIQALLPKVVAPGTYLSTGARSLLEGGRRTRLPRFEQESDYAKYVTWLYQLAHTPGPFPTPSTQHPTPNTQAETDT